MRITFGQFLLLLILIAAMIFFVDRVLAKPHDNTENVVVPVGACTQDRAAIILGGDALKPILKYIKTKGWEVEILSMDAWAEIVKKHLCE